MPVGVEHDALEQRLTDRLHHAAVALPLDDHRVHHGPEIVHQRIAHDRDHAGLRIDLDLRDMAAVGVGRRRGLVHMADVERFGAIFRQARCGAQALRQFDHADRPVRPRDGKRAA